MTMAWGCTWLMAENRMYPRVKVGSEARTLQLMSQAPIVFSSAKDSHQKAGISHLLHSLFRISLPPPEPWRCGNIYCH